MVCLCLQVNENEDGLFMFTGELERGWSVYVCR